MGMLIDAAAFDEEEEGDEMEEEFLMASVVGGALKGAMGGVLGAAGGGGGGGGYRGPSPQNPQTAMQLSQATNGIRDLKYKMDRNKDTQRQQHRELTRQLRQIKRTQNKNANLMGRNARN